MPFASSFTEFFATRGAKRRAEGATAATAAFAELMVAKQIHEIQGSFEKVAKGCARPERAPRLEDLVSGLAARVPHRSKQLLTAVDAARKKRAAPHCEGLTAVIIGGGPIGLRCAIELAMLGVSVQVLERRSCFTRLQVLHLWDFVEQDLIELGIKSLDPTVFAAADFKHVATSQLQHSLLKVALLLGVNVRYGCSVDSLHSLRLFLRDAAPAPPPLGALGRSGSARFVMTHIGDGGGGEEAVGGGTRQRPAPSVVADLPDVLIDATGARCKLFDSLGFGQVTVLKSARALCIVMHLVNQKSGEELRLQESTWSKQFHQAKFEALRSDGVSLENIVYYRSTGEFAPQPTHYFVMTTELDALLAYGALTPAPEGVDPCHPSHIVSPNLEGYARKAVGAFVPFLKDREMVPGQLSLFDFSERKQSNRAAAIVPADLLGGAREEGDLLVTRVGDALQEPFWPEGLGINRGFLHCLDCADLVLGYASVLKAHRDAVGAQPEHIQRGVGPAMREAVEAIVARREALFACTKRVSGHTRKKELKPHIRRQASAAAFSYTVDPHTRYASLPANVVMSASQLALQAQKLIEALESEDGNAELKALYARLDVDGDGKLTSGEWSAGLAANVGLLAKFFGESTTSSDGEQLFRRIDEDGNGSLSWEEFCSGAKALQRELNRAAT